MTRNPSAARRQLIYKWLFLLPVICYVSMFFFFPVLTNLEQSFRGSTIQTFLRGNAPFIGFDNYAAIFNEPLFWRAVANTAIFTVVSLVGQFVIGFTFAVYFNRRFALNRLFRALLLLPWLLPLVVSGTIFRWALDQDHGVFNAILVNVGLASEGVPWLSDPQIALLSVTLVNIWVGIPFVFVTLYGGLQGIPDDVIEAAKIDGAGAIRVFWSITLPLLRPVILVVQLLGLIYTIRAFDLIILLTQGGPANSTQTLATLSYFRSFTTFDFGQGSAISNILIVVAMVFALLYIRVTNSEKWKVSQ
ncbi:sugar ABC transporter permease [Salinibacterium sp. G-O1]|uniref:carbohydrate ABC transporter permease n=1 Tax=Salinibacterium sp. G-O1 TaxID=3046208 RepID=UPI0024BAD57E|nr:sugar ABC transporter permease [Salinibacterium sp. G-O1]MDJ0336084.1 sugar ABC transporter permease [Salinibacterium sp. G-O1]